MVRLCVRLEEEDGPPTPQGGGVFVGFGYGVDVSPTPLKRIHAPCRNFHCDRQEKCPRAKRVGLVDLCWQARTPTGSSALQRFEATHQVCKSGALLCVDHRRERLDGLCSFAQGTFGDRPGSFRLREMSAKLLHDLCGSDSWAICGVEQGHDMRCFEASPLPRDCPDHVCKGGWPGCPRLGGLLPQELGFVGLEAGCNPFVEPMQFNNVVGHTSRDAEELAQGRSLVPPSAEDTEQEGLALLITQGAQPLALQAAPSDFL